MASGKGHAFDDHWMPRWKLEQDRDLRGCRFMVSAYGQFRSSRRPRFLWEAVRGGEAVSRRLAMRLVSKRTGQPYDVVSREEYALAEDPTMYGPGTPPGLTLEWLWGTAPPIALP